MIVFDTDRLQSIARDFYNLTDLPINIYDSNFKPLCWYPDKKNPLCKMIRSTPFGEKLCKESDREGCLIAQRVNAPYIHTCHAGLCDVFVPVTYENTAIAFIVFGQTRDKEEIYVNLNNLKTLMQKYDIPAEVVEEYYNTMDTLTHDRIMAAANFLTMATLYLQTSQIIKIEQNTIVSAIEKYITENLKTLRKVDEICDTFNLSQSSLYKLSHVNFKMSIGNYITFKRINMAKQLLVETAYPISSISEQCGFDDYNYFIRKFKRQTGYTPLVYRKKMV